MKNKEFKPFIRPEVLAFKPYTPGQSIDNIKKRFNLRQVIKLASNENPLGASPCVQKAIANYAGFAFRYPTSGNPDLRQALAKYHKLDAKNIVVGNGSDEIIDLLLRLSSTPKKNNVVAFKPCFGIYTTQANLCGLELRQANLNPDFSFDLKVLRNLIDENTSCAFITNPDNPSGFALKKSELLRFAAELPSTCLLVVDEAYIDFCDSEDEYSLIKNFSELPNVAILRTFSKSRGLAGLRLGYAVLPEILADYYNRIRLPFSVNILAEKAGLSALEDDVFYHETMRVIKQGRDFLNAELTRLNCTVYPSMANFIMFKPANLKNNDCHYIFEALLACGIIIRPLHSYDLPQLLRVSIGTEDENSKFIKSLESTLCQ